jgi:hypothetical protein
LIRSLRNFTGVDPEGINLETAATLESAILIQLQNKPSLSIPKAALIIYAKYLSACSSAGLLSDREMALATGILPAFRFLVYEDTRSFSSFKKGVPAAGRHLRSHDMRAANPVASTIRETEADVYPFKGDYSCKSCGQELFNSYFRCSTCAEDICRQCHTELATPKECSHTSDAFNARKRFFGEDAGMEELLAKLEAMVGGKSVEYAEETVVRLKVVANPNDKGLKDEVEKLRKKNWKNFVSKN